MKLFVLTTLSRKRLDNDFKNVVNLIDYILLILLFCSGIFIQWEIWLNTINSIEVLDSHHSLLKIYYFWELFYIFCKYLKENLIRFVINFLVVAGNIILSDQVLIEEKALSLFELLKQGENIMFTNSSWIR